MTFGEYLKNTKKIADEERGILDQLASRGSLGPIEIRAAKSSLQVLIENCIGKAKRILKHYNCPIVPKSGRDAVSFMYEMGLIDDECYHALVSAIGFRNAMIHDYMKFDEEILAKIVRERHYLDLYDFLVEVPTYTDVQRKRIENFVL